MVFSIKALHFLVTILDSTKNYKDIWVDLKFCNISNALNADASAFVIDIAAGRTRPVKTPTIDPAASTGTPFPAINASWTKQILELGALALVCSYIVMVSFRRLIAVQAARRAVYKVMPLKLIKASSSSA